MINLLRKIFGTSSESCFYDKFLRATKSSKHDTINITKKAYYLGGFKYEEKIYKEFIDKLKNNGFIIQVSDLKYDTQFDNIELYLIETVKNDSFLFVMFDPLELYQAEEIIDVFPVPKDSFQDIDKKLIYSR